MHNMSVVVLLVHLKQVGVVLQECLHGLGESEGQAVFLEGQSIFQLFGEKRRT